MGRLQRSFEKNSPDAKAVSTINERFEFVFGLLVQRLSWVAPEAVAPLLPDPPTGESAAPFVRREILTHHDAFAGCPY